MRPTFAIAIASSVFTIMAVAAHAQFTLDREMKDGRLQVDATEDYKKYEPLPANWQETPYQSDKAQYVTSPEEVREIFQTVAASINNGAVAQTAPQPVQNTTPQQAYTPTSAGSNCSIAIANAEKKYGIPPYLLRAIALTESGRNGEPYPWAMNIMGKAHYASGPGEMIGIVDRYGSRSSIDIGCAQVNLKFHGHRFTDWRSLLDPQTNADYAAYHILELRREFGSWSRAVGAYHSRTPWRGQNYACEVSRNYGKIFGDQRKGCGPDIEILANHLLRNPV